MSVRVPRSFCPPHCVPEWIRKQDGGSIVHYQPREPSGVGDFSPRTTQMSGWILDMLRSSQILITWVLTCIKFKSI